MKTIWTLNFSKEAQKQFEKLDKSTQRKIRDYFKKRILNAPDPFVYAKPLRHELVNLWRYRIGDYRVICSIHDGTLVINIIKMGHRREIYH